MNENRGMTTKIIDIKEFSNKEVGLLTQAVLTELVIIFSIICMISDAFMPAFYAIIDMLMFNLAYNNKRIFKKKYMTNVYLIVGIFVLITTLVEYVF